MNRVRCIHHFKNGFKWTPPDDLGGGPGIGNLNDLYYLNEEEWLEIKHTSIEECTQDDVMPWYRGNFNVDSLPKVNNNKIILGPNTIFTGMPNTEETFERPLLESDHIKSIMVLNDTHISYAAKINPDETAKKVRKVRHFMRPIIYNTPLYTGKMIWDVLFLIKGNVRQELKLKFKKWTALFNMWFQYDELIYKAQRSKVCIVGSQWDTYGLAAHEINCYGCPLVVSEDGMMKGNMEDGTMGKYLTKDIHSQYIGKDMDEVLEAHEELSQWNRKDVRDAALDFHNPNKLKKMYKDAIFGE
tara:strand:+ start:187 stop:1086 length:900 start_codon:yes stop_codon:yes gene_type:complete